MLAAVEELPFIAIGGKRTTFKMLKSVYNFNRNQQRLVAAKPAGWCRAGQAALALSRQCQCGRGCEVARIWPPSRSDSGQALAIIAGPTRTVIYIQSASADHDAGWENSDATYKFSSNFAKLRMSRNHWQGGPGSNVIPNEQ